MVAIPEKQQEGMEPMDEKMCGQSLMHQNKSRGFWADASKPLPAGEMCMRGSMRTGYAMHGRLPYAPACMIKAAAQRAAWCAEGMRASNHAARAKSAACGC